MSDILPQDLKPSIDRASIPRSEATLPPPDEREPLRRQQAVVALGRRAVASPELSILMQDGAAMIAEMLGVEYHAVAELSPNGSALVVTLARTEADSPTFRARARELSSRGSESLAGYALQVAHPVVVTDLTEESRFSDALLRKHGIRSGIAAPLQLLSQSFGALLACSSQVRQFNSEDVLFIESIAHLITTTIARSRSERTLREERRLSAGVFQTVGGLILVLDAQGQIFRINRACEELTGFSLDEIKDRPIWSVFPVPGEEALFPTIFQKLRAGVSPVEYESLLLTKHSDRRRIAWSYAAMYAADGSIESIIATGIDVTRQRKAEQEASRAERAAEAARQVVKRLLEAAAKAEENGMTSGDGRPAPGPGQGDLPDGPTSVINGERRRRSRRSFPYQQLIAPILDGRMPDPHDFVAIECNDIAAGGFSYLSDTRPEADAVVVALGTPPTFTYLSAKVAHVTPVEHGSELKYMIGCTYTGRVSL